jgi:hypothetical protein
LAVDLQGWELYISKLLNMNVKNIEEMKFVWPAESEGVGVDRGTLLPVSNPPPKKRGEEAVELFIKFHGEKGWTGFDNRKSLPVYREVLKLFSKQD